MANQYNMLLKPVASEEVKKMIGIDTKHAARELHSVWNNGINTAFTVKKYEVNVP